jgi:hypothetical protein
VWPIAGYWSSSDTEAPTACNFPEACPGFVLEYSGNSPVGVQTAVCTDGYESDGCSTCSDGLYFRDGYRCGICGDSAIASFFWALLLACVIFTVMGLFLAFLPAHRLFQPVQVFLGFQWASLMLAIVNPYIDDPAWAEDVIEVAGVYTDTRLSLSLFWPLNSIRSLTAIQPFRLVKSLT